MRVIAAVLLALMAGTFVTASIAGAQSRARLTGRLLVATDEIRDPRFTRTVVYLVRHDEHGAFGLIINRPLGDTKIEEVLRGFDVEAPPGGAKIRVHYGGPVEGSRGFVLHSPDWKGDGTVVLGAAFALTTRPAILHALAEGTGPRRAILALGYAGWTAGQLEGELTRGAWAVALADEALVFDEDPHRKWEQATARRLIDL